MHLAPQCVLWAQSPWDVLRPWRTTLELGSRNASNRMCGMVAEMILSWEQHPICIYLVATVVLCFPSCVVSNNTHAGDPSKRT